MQMIKTLWYKSVNFLMFGSQGVQIVDIVRFCVNSFAPVGLFIIFKGLVFPIFLFVPSFAALLFFRGKKQLWSLFLFLFTFVNSSFLFETSLFFPFPFPCILSPQHHLITLMIVLIRLFIILFFILIRTTQQVSNLVDFSGEGINFIRYRYFKPFLNLSFELLNGSFPLLFTNILAQIF